MRLAYAAMGIVLIMCMACASLARRQNVPTHGGSVVWPRQNDHMSAGWPGAKADAEKQDSIRPLVRQGNQAVALGHYAEGESLFRKALAIYPHDATSLLRLAEVCERENKQAEALKAYQALVYARGWGSSINSDITTLMRYVLALSGSNRWPEAVEVCDRASRQQQSASGKPLTDVAFNSGAANWAGMKAAAHLVLGTRRPTYGPVSAKERMAHLEAAVRAQPNWATAQFAYGQELEQVGRYAEAKAAYEKAVKHAAPELRDRASGALRILSQRTQGVGASNR